MSELEFQYPSDQPYAHFAVRGTPEELAAMDFELLAQLYVNTQFAVLKGTVAAKDAILSAKSEPIDPPESAVGVDLSDNTPLSSEAVETLSEGLGGATEIPDVNAPPWKGEQPVAKPKPWEKNKPATEVSSDDFDF